MLTIDIFVLCTVFLFFTNGVTGQYYHPYSQQPFGMYPSYPRPPMMYPLGIQPRMPFSQPVKDLRTDSSASPPKPVNENQPKIPSYPFNAYPGYLRPAPSYYPPGIQPRYMPQSPFMGYPYGIQPTIIKELNGNPKLEVPPEETPKAPSIITPLAPKSLIPTNSVKNTKPKTKPKIPVFGFHAGDIVDYEYIYDSLPEDDEESLTGSIIRIYPSKKTKQTPKETIKPITKQTVKQVSIPEPEDSKKKNVPKFYPPKWETEKWEKSDPPPAVDEPFEEDIFNPDEDIIDENETDDVYDEENGFEEEDIEIMSDKKKDVKNDVQPKVDTKKEKEAESKLKPETDVKYKQELEPKPKSKSTWWG